jgi:lipopolysaccharide/colanic/teichoic acid biosynthesis glycosyltransferase
MLTGVEYAHSQEKRDFDRYAIRYMRPFALMARRALLHSGVSRDDVEFRQTRVGQNEELIEVYKLRTLQEDGLTLIDSRAAFLRRSGMDELIQYKNVQEDDMNVVARRPLTPTEYEEAFDEVPGHVVDDYRRIVVPTLPGLVGSFVIESHLGTIAGPDMHLQRLNMEIQDVVDGSRARDKQLFWSAVTKGLTNKMRQGAIRAGEIEQAES